MVLGTSLIGIIGQFVIVPDADKGLFLMRQLQLRIAAVLFVTSPVVTQVNDFFDW